MIPGDNFVFAIFKNTETATSGGLHNTSRCSS